MRVLLFCLLLMPMVSRAQTKPDTTIYTTVERQPEYPGGDVELNRALSKGINIPARVRQEDISSYGRVLITFVVEKDGTISHGKTIRGNKDLGQQMIKIVSAAVWKPGVLKGKIVRVQYSTPNEH